MACQGCKLTRVKYASVGESRCAHLFRDPYPLDAFLEERVKRVLAGEADTLEPIHYDSES